MRIETTTTRVDTAGSGQKSQGETALSALRNVRLTNEATPETDRWRQPVSKKTVAEAVDKANQAIQLVYTQLEFSIHEKTGEVMVKVRNSDSGEVIREIPPEKFLDMVACIWETLGIIIDEKV